MFIGGVNNIFYSFLWNNKGDKIKRTLLISNFDHGGLKMVDLSSFIYLSRLGTSLRKYLDSGAPRAARSAARERSSIAI